MEKRKLKHGNSESKKKKYKKSKDSTLNTEEVDYNLENKNNDVIDSPKPSKHSRKNSGKQKKVENTKAKDFNQTSNMQNLLTEKLKRAQKKRSDKADIKDISMSVETTKQVDQVPNKRGLDNLDLQRDPSEKIKRNKKESTNNTIEVAATPETGTNYVNKEPGGEDELDPEKAAIREKKREKRKQKKLNKLKLKEQDAARAGSSKNAANEYLDQWKNNRAEWKFLKVRQVWLLQNMYDQKMIDDDSFEILLEYLEGLKGKSREVTVSEAEKVLEKSETENDESSSSTTDRARQIIQLLSD